MVIAQDSYYVDAGSVVFYAPLFPVVSSPRDYDKFVDLLTRPPSPFPYGSWQEIRARIVAWNVNLEFSYITDAAKVYRIGSWKDGNFDRSASAALLHDEIKACSPQLIILLGAQPLHLLRRDLSYATAVESGKPILIQGINCVVSPFFIGNGRSQKNFHLKLATASRLIRSLLTGC